VVALSRLLLQEPIDRREAPFLVAAALGLLLVFFGSQDAVATAPAPQLGNACALASGFTFALLLVYFRRLSRTDPTRDRSLAAATVGNVLACALSLPFALPVAHATATDVLAILYLGTMQVGLAYFFLSRGLRVLPALEVSLLLLLEPVLNPVWTWLLHDERPTLLALAGGAVLLGVLATRARLIAPRA
jgi:drug/metabolite transporter (DMT)-like permease